MSLDYLLNQMLNEKRELDRKIGNLEGRSDPESKVALKELRRWSELIGSWIFICNGLKRTLR